MISGSHGFTCLQSLTSSQPEPKSIIVSYQHVALSKYKYIPKLDHSKTTKYPKTMETMDTTDNDSTESTIITDGSFSSKFPFLKLKSPKALPIPDRTELFYPMSAKPTRGRCLILNYDNFSVLQNNGPRPGSQVDVHELRNTFEYLGFEILVHQNMSSKMTQNILEAESKFDHSKYDCFALCILTHGGMNDVLFCTDGPLTVEEDVIQKFTPSQCPSLVGKPKLLFIQACRGEILDAGTLVTDSGKGPSSREDDDDMGNPFRLPTHADFLIFYSAYKGHYSWRNPTLGSWFIQDLCHIFNSYAHVCDLMTMLTLVCKEVAFNRQSNCPKTQPEMHQKVVMPCFLSTLTRVLKFSGIQ